jgi:hypothetical protein
MSYQYVYSATSWEKRLNLSNQGVCLKQKGQRLTNTALEAVQIRGHIGAERGLTCSTENDSLDHCVYIREKGDWKKEIKRRMTGFYTLQARRDNHCEATDPFQSDNR